MQATRSGLGFPITLRRGHPAQLYHPTQFKRRSIEFVGAAPRRESGRRKFEKLRPGAGLLRKATLERLRPRI